MKRWSTFRCGFRVNAASDATPVQLRPIARTDAALIARLHAASWRSAYRGIVLDRYLDGDVFADRLRHWEKRLTESTPDRYGFVACEKGEPVGFSFAFVAEDAQWGTLIDNLHVLPDRKRSGLGRTLLRAMFKGALERSPSQGVFLWVYEQNQPARRFYEQMGGQPVERALARSPDGRDYPEWRYVWRDPAQFVATT